MVWIIIYCALRLCTLLSCQRALVGARGCSADVHRYVNAPKATCIIYHDLNLYARYLEWKSGESADEIVFIALLN